MLEGAKELKVHTPYGMPSDVITVGNYKGTKVAFLPKHGKGHRLPPHKVPYRANIWAMKELGVKRLIVPTAVGSLRPEIKPGEIVVPDQISISREGGNTHSTMVGKWCMSPWRNHSALR